MDVAGALAVLACFGEVLNKVRIFQFEFGGSKAAARTYLRDFWHIIAKLAFGIHRITPLDLQLIHKCKAANEVFTTPFLAYQPNLSFQLAALYVALGIFTHKMTKY